MQAAPVFVAPVGACAVGRRQLAALTSRATPFRLLNTTCPVAAAHVAIGGGSDAAAPIEGAVAGAAAGRQNQAPPASPLASPDQVGLVPSHFACSGAC